MNINNYNAILKSEYSTMASWAIWKDADPMKGISSNIHDMDVFSTQNTESLLKMLNPHFVLVGLNVSREILIRKDGYEGPWANFHSDSQYQKDFRLRYALKDTKAWGAYLTDIIKNYPEVNSDNVIHYLDNNPEVEKKSIEQFEEELSLIGENDPTIIALGDKVFNILIRNLGGKYRIAKAKHYSSYQNIEEYKKEFQMIINRSR